MLKRCNTDTSNPHLFTFWYFQTFTRVNWFTDTGTPVFVRVEVKTKDESVMSSSASAVGSPQELRSAQDDSKVNSARIGRPRKPAAKSRDTARYRPWTGYLVRDTITEAEYLLKRTNPDGTRDARDMSDLIQDLLAAWVSEREGTGRSVSQTGPLNALG